MRRKNIVISLVIFIMLLLAVAWGPIVSHVEKAKYTIAEHQGAIEIRDYPALIVAEAQTTGQREMAIKQGFRILADYIFGNNMAAQKIAMTAPVIQQSGEKIAMTAPVMQQQSASGNWIIRFMMPTQYSMAQLPKPNNQAVHLKEIAAKRYAVIRFSGTATQKRLQEQQAILEAFIKQHGLKPLAKPMYAFFNPPWTLPFLRRNEVMIEVAK